VARELVTVWAVHLHRSYRLVRGACPEPTVRVAE
jgi:hypothetical protein